MFVDEMADACLYIHDLPQNIFSFHTSAMGYHVNIGCGKDIEISKLAEMIKRIVGYRGNIKFDASKPDGTPRKSLDVSLLKKLGWESSLSLTEGLRLTYEDFKQMKIFRNK